MQLLRIPGVPLILLTFFGYCAMESTAGLWASSYLVNARGVEAETAARFASLYFLGITLGRFLNGFIADRFGDKTMIRAGLGLAAVSILIILLPWQLCPLHWSGDAGHWQRADLSLHHSFHARVLWP